MRNRLAVLLVLAAGCGSTTLDSDIGLSEPVGVAIFTGITSKNADLHPYVAIANGGRNDLTLVDVLDNQPVISPVVVRALAVPLDARPGFVVAGSLRDGKADLLAVVPAGSNTVQLIRTWTADNQALSSVDLAEVAPGAKILSVVASAVPLAGGALPDPGRVRLVFGLTGGRLAVQEYVRVPDDAAAEPGGIAPSGAPAVQAVGFDPVSLAVAPADDDAPAYAEPLGRRLLYAATPDDLPDGSGLHGVVELDMSSAPGAWSTSLLPTLAPTRLVAAAKVAERAWGANRDEIPDDAPYVLRVVAALDPSGCGLEEEIACGLVTVDPSPGVRGIALDPMSDLPYQPPAQLPAEPVALLAAIPPAVPSETHYDVGRMTIQTGQGERETSGVIGVAAANGRMYTFDLARRTVLNDATMLREIAGDSQTRTRAQVVFFERSDPEPETHQIYPVHTCTVTRDDDGNVTELECEHVSSDLSAASDGVVVTPGYTRDDTVDVIWQGAIPGLAARDAEVGAEGGVLFVALQTRTPAGVGAAARVYDPGFGVHVGDSVELFVNELDATDAQDPCDVADVSTSDADESELDPHEFTIAALVPPDATRFPGGALLLADDGSACYDSLRAGWTGATATVRAADWVLSSRTYGYLGRAVTRSAAGEKDRRIRARVAYEDETALACPLSPWPDSPESVVCDATCRTTCERLSIARKARRWYHVADSCTTDTTCIRYWMDQVDPDVDGDPATTDPALLTRSTPPNIRGPMFSFDFTVRDIDEDTGGISSVLPEAVNRGGGIQVTLTSGHRPASRYPLGGAILMPTGMAAYDRSGHDKDESYRFYVSYIGDLVLDYSPSQIPNAPITIR